MKTSAACLLATVSLFAQQPPDRANDEAAIKRVVQKYVEARENRDQSAIGTLFTADADQLVSTGEWRRGRKDVVRGTMSSSQSSPRKRTITVVSVRFVSPGVALADGRYEIAGDATRESRKMWTTLVLARVWDGWRISAIRNMLPAPASATK